MNKRCFFSCDGRADTARAKKSANEETQKKIFETYINKKMHESVMSNAIDRGALGALRACVCVRERGEEGAGYVTAGAAGDGGGRHHGGPTVFSSAHFVFAYGGGSGLGDGGGGGGGDTAIKTKPPPTVAAL